jgi:hypothetical protein
VRWWSPASSDASRAACARVFSGGVEPRAGSLRRLKGAAYLGLVLIVLERLVPTSAMQLAIEGSMLGPR